MSGAAGVLALLLATSETTAGPVSSGVQLAIVAALMAVLGPITAHRAMAKATTVAPGDAGSGEPTPLWQLVLIAAVLTVGFGLAAGWDIGLRAAGGCAIVGLGQALLIERIVAAGERRAGGRYVRLSGSRILRGTRLGLVTSS